MIKEAGAIMSQRESKKAKKGKEKNGGGREATGGGMVK